MACSKSYYLLVVILTVLLVGGNSILSSSPYVSGSEVISAGEAIFPLGLDPEKLDTIKIARHDTESELNERTLEAAATATFNIDLELGESIENQIISLQPVAGDTRRFKVHQQFETSMAIGDEGPHIDLVDWKHYTSDWKEIEKLGENRFLTARIPEGDTQRFPSVTPQEIHRVILKAGGKRWGDLARQCKTPFDGPCYVGLSRISFRISANENGVWTEIHRINFSIPLGC